MASPTFSIITVTFNASPTIERTLKSVAEQTCRDFEHIVMDGASKDDTVEKARKFGIDGIRIFSEPDKGLYDAMNKAMDRAKGTYLIFLNSGDKFHSPDTLELIKKAVDDNDIPGIVYGQTNLVDNEGRYLGPRHLTAPKDLTYRSFTNGMVVCHQAFIALARIAPEFNLKYRLSADYEWCLRCLQHSRKNVFIDDCLIDYLSEGLSTANRRASLWERFRIMCRYYGTVPTIIRHVRFAFRFMRTQANTSN